jgi:ParB-like chromosome segregation protein Spo0J
MGKLSDMARIAGLTAGAEVMAKTVRPPDILFDPELDIFEINEDLVASIAASMREHGFDKSQPLVLWKGRGCVVDGRTRLKAALEAGLAEVTAVEKEFASLEEAIQYAFSRQAERRNLSQGEILEASIRLGLKDRRDGTGRGRERLARDLGVSESTVKRARAVAARGSDGDLESIRKGEKTINRVYRDLRKKGGEKPEEESGGRDAGEEGAPDHPPAFEGPGGAAGAGGVEDPLGGGLPGSGLFSREYRAEGEDRRESFEGDTADGPGSGEEADGEGGNFEAGAGADDDSGEEKEGEERYTAPDSPDRGGGGEESFLRSAVILLCENGQLESADLLIAHFAGREKRELFIETLPEEAREKINESGKAV